jgi:hypothetical protein
MLVASIVAALIAICAAVEALDRISRFYNRRCEDSFGVKLLSEKAVAGWAGLMALVCFGDTWRRYAAAAGRDELDGALLMGVGALGGLAWLILNLRRTNIAYGVAGTALHGALPERRPSPAGRNSPRVLFRGRRRPRRATARPEPRAFR